MNLAFRRAGALVFLALAAPPAAARAGASLEAKVDPRFELIAVVRQLSGRASADAGDADYIARIEKSFGAFREHPAVVLYRELAGEPALEAALATMPIYYTNPPELALLDPDADIHHLNAPGSAEAAHRFLHELRGFARDSGFQAFFKDNRGFYAELEAAAKKSRGALDPVAAIERYIGLSLASTAHYFIMPLAAPAHAFIVPYPLPPGAAGAKSFDVYSPSPDFAHPAFTNVYWHEPLFVFIDPAFHYFEKLNVPVPAEFYGAEIARCRGESPDCVKNFAVMALIERLNRSNGVPPIPADENEHPLVKALAARLVEYEARRDVYPTLWHFLPRWLAVFEESAFPRRRPRRLFTPAEPRLASAADFFDPSISQRLLRAGAP